MKRNSNQDLYFENDDALGWESYARNILGIIRDCDSYPRSNDNDSYVIGIDSPWGNGKTYFSKMLKNALEGFFHSPDSERMQKPPFPCSVVYYDAWENDFWDNAFEPFFDRLVSSQPFKNAREDADARKMLKHLGKMLGIGISGFTAKLLEDKIGANALKEMHEEAMKFLNAGTKDGTQVEEIFPEYTGFRDAIVLLRKYLKDVVAGNGTEKKKLVIIIDELDRCKPTFAVQTLEIVKHLFNVEGLVFVFSLDISQLSHCVKQVYGRDFEAVGYLERFFNYLTLLPRNDCAVACKAFMQEFKLQLNDAAQVYFIEVMNAFHLSLREMRTVLASFYVLSRTVLLPYQDMIPAQTMYFFFLTLKYKHPGEFAEAVFHNNIEEALNIIQETSEQFGEMNPLSSMDTLHALFELLRENRLLGESYEKHFAHCKHEAQTTVVDHFNSLSGLKGAFETHDSLSLLLFRPDLEDTRIDSIKRLTPWEYLYRQIDMCDFVGEKKRNSPTA